MPTWTSPTLNEDGGYNLLGEFSADFDDATGDSEFDAATSHDWIRFYVEVIADPDPGDNLFCFAACLDSTGENIAGTYSKTVSKPAMELAAEIVGTPYDIYLVGIASLDPIPTFDGPVMADGEFYVQFVPDDPQEFNQFTFQLTASEDNVGENGTIRLKYLEVGYNGAPPDIPDNLPGSLAMKIEPQIWNASNTALVDEPVAPINPQFQLVENDLGGGSLTLLIDDAQDLALGNHIRHYVDGELACTSVIETLEKVQVGSNRSDLQVTASGRGVGAIFDHPVVMPFGGYNALPRSTSRPFNFASPEIDITQFDHVYIYYNKISRQINGDPPWHEPWFEPIGWPTELAPWVWSADHGVNFPTGKSYFFDNFSLASETVVTFFHASDNRHRMFINGLLVNDWVCELPDRALFNSWRTTVRLAAGTYRLCWEVEVYNYSWPGSPPGTAPRGMFTYCAHSEPDYTSGYSGSTILRQASSSMYTLDYPVTLPAPTPGKVLRTIIAEAQTENFLTGVTCSFDEYTDSKGNPWSTPMDIELRIGDTYTDVLRQLSETTIDWAFSNSGKVLSVWNKGTRGSTVAATFADGSNIHDLTRTRSE